MSNITSNSNGQYKLAKGLETLNIFQFGVNLMPAMTMGLFLSESSSLEKEKAFKIFSDNGGNIQDIHNNMNSLINKNLCPMYSTCGKNGGRNCLLGSGQNWMTQASKVAKTLLYHISPDIFWHKIEKETTAKIKKTNMAISGRFNLLSDLPSDSIKFHNILFDNCSKYKKEYHGYEYTKLSYGVWNRALNKLNKDINFRLVYSVNRGGGDNKSANKLYKNNDIIAKEIKPFLDNNQSAAIIITNMQGDKEKALQLVESKGLSVVDGDIHDVRTLDKPSSIVLLTAKGMLRTHYKKVGTESTDVFDLEQLSDLCDKIISQ